MTDDKIQTVFDHWNSYKGMGKWKSSPNILPYHKEVIRFWLRKGYSVEQMSDAINNYAKVLLGRDYKWSRAWTLREFLTRTRPHDRSEKQFIVFLDFCEDDYLTPAAVSRRINARKEQYEATPKEVQILYGQVGKKVPGKPNTNALRNEAVRKLNG